MTRVFSPEQANRMLPLVRRIVRDIVQTHGAWAESIAAFELASGAPRSVEATRTADVLQRETQRLAEEIQGFLVELAELGLEMKDYQQGLVDFPGERDGRPVLLCWRFDEPRVAFWHEVDAGFAGRQPLESDHELSGLRPAT